MRRQTFPIDWRHEFAALQPFLDGRGGVVGVKYTGDRCAPNSFAETLTSVYEGRWNGQNFTAKNRDWRSLRIDRHNYKVRYLPEIRTEFMRKLELDLPGTVSTSQASGTVHIASNNTAGGDQTFETEVRYGDDDVARRWHRDEWIESLCTQLEQFLAKGHFMVILMHGSSEDQREFWESLWHGGMSGLVEKGLFLVRMIDRNDTAAGEHHRAAQPDVEISLPPELYAEQQAHAIEDIANWITRRIPTYTPEQARLLAKGRVLAHSEDLNILHGKVGFWLTKLKQQAG